jgi:exonuclease III
MRCKPITIFQANVAHKRTAHLIALQLAFQHNFDLVCIQEPWIGSEYHRKFTCSHPGYDTHIALDSWDADNRPRTATYARKGAGLQTEQLRPFGQQGDLVVTVTNGITVYNVYNARERHNAASLLASHEAPKRKTVILGDFNMHHRRWEPQLLGQSTNRATSFIKWLDSGPLTLLNNPGDSTHNRGHTLDLAFVTPDLLIWGASTTIEKSLNSTSDHCTLTITVPLQEKQRVHGAGKLMTGLIEESAFKERLQSYPLPPRTSLATTEELDQEAIIITEAISKTAASLAPRKRDSARGNPWWTEECSEAMRDRETPEGAKHAQQVVANAKRNYYNQVIANASTPKEAFTIAGWHKLTGRYTTIPLTDGNGYVAVTTEDKARLLRRKILTEAACANDIQPEESTPGTGHLPFPPPEEPEIQETLLDAGNTSPGDDEISVSLLRMAWPILRKRITALFRASLELGHYPKPFRNADVVFIPKTGKRDQSLPKSYRPISLLRTLGKGLERLVARRLAWVAIKYNVLHPQQFGALPLRSSADLTACLVHDVEEAWEKDKKLISSVLTADIKGAFNAVLPGRLLRRLRKQGWPDNVARWVYSFATGRTARIKLDNVVIPPEPVTCGLPQGSPTSPILFMLHISPIFFLPGANVTNRYGYADDIALRVTGLSAEENTARLAQSMQDILDWGALEGITIDHDKSKLIHFARGRTVPTATIQLPDITISPVKKGKTMEWLGVLFDRKLTFQDHTKRAAGKALAVANAIRALGNTVRGLPPHLARQTVAACVYGSASYAAETWWRGIEVRGYKGRGRLLDKAFKIAARAVAPAYKTTPIPALLREAGLPPARIHFEAIRRRAAARLFRLDSNHPLAQRIFPPRSSKSTSLTKLSALAQPATERADPILFPPWGHHNREKSWRRHSLPSSLQGHQML